MLKTEIFDIEDRLRWYTRISESFKGFLKYKKAKIFDSESECGGAVVRLWVLKDF